jgi:hypothetical protein
MILKQKALCRRSSCPSSLSRTSLTPQGLPPGSLRRHIVAAALLLASTPFLAQSAHAQDQSQSAPAPVTRGLLACYLFDEGSGTIANDCSGNGNTAILGGSGSVPTWSALGMHLGAATGSSWQWATTPVPSASVVSFSLGYVSDTTINLGGTVYNGSSQQYLVTGTTLGAPTIALEGMGPSMDLYEAHYPTFFNKTVWNETGLSSLWGHQVLGVTCGVAGNSAAANSYFIDGVKAPTSLESTKPVSCNQPAVTGTFVIGASPSLEEDQWTVQGTVTAALLYSVPLTAEEQAQNSAYIASLSKARGYSGVPVYSGPKVNHLVLTGDSITDCFGTGYGNCWAHTVGQSLPGYNPTVVNFGLSGSSAVGSMQAVIARECAYISPGSKQNVVHIFLGTNDLSDSKEPPTNEQIGAALASGIHTLHGCTDAIDADVKIAIATMLSRGVKGATTCGEDAAKDSFDAYLAANWKSLGADILDDYAATPMGYDDGCLDTNNFQADETHPTLDGGNNNLAPVAIATTSYLLSTESYPACSAAPVHSATTLTPGNVCTNATASDGPVVVTLPDCTGFNGAPFYIRNLSSAQQSQSSSLTVSVAAPGSQTLDGRANMISVPNGATAMMVSTVATYSGGGCAWNAALVNPQTTTVVNVSSQKIIAGQTATLTATIAPMSPASPFPGPTPSGTVTFYAGKLLLGTTIVKATGVASLTASSAGAPLGTFPVTAVYSGGGAYSASTSLAVPVSIQSPTAVSFQATPVVVPSNGVITLTSTVNRTGFSGNPTGAITFESEGMVLGSAQLHSTGGHSTATFRASTAGIARGTYPVTATYSGDETDAVSVSPAVVVDVLQ